MSLISCDICGKTFTRKNNHARHVKSHGAKDYFICPELLASGEPCGKKYTRNSDLTIHRRTHTGEKPYSCGVCGARFTRNSDCRSHERTHAKEDGCKLIKCSVGDNAGNHARNYGLADHVHSGNCGHQLVQHGDHYDYLVAHDDHYHLHYPHDQTHCDDHGHFFHNFENSNCSSSFNYSLHGNHLDVCDSKHDHQSSNDCIFSCAGSINLFDSNCNLASKSTVLSPLFAPSALLPYVTPIDSILPNKK